jgi:uncharacterized protein YwgA
MGRKVKRLKLMKNIEIVNAINNLNTFVEHQRATGQTFLTVKGQFAIKVNNDALMAKYKPYSDTFNELKEKYTKDGKVDESNEDFQKELKELLDLEIDDINLRKITENDFFNGVTIDDIVLLDFMTE